MKVWLQAENRAAFEHARLLTRHYAKSFYLSARLLPEEKRWATYALYGFCRHADNLIDLERDRGDAEVLWELEALQQELEIGYKSGESLNPVIRPLILVAKQYDIPMQYPADLLAGVRMDVEKKRYETFDDLYLFCYRVAGVVGLMMTHVLGYRSERAFQYAEKLGIAMQLTNILRDVQEDSDMGRIYLPLQELAEFGCNEACITSSQFSPECQSLMKFQVERAHQYYDEADPGIRLLHPDARFAIYSASRVYRGILRHIEHRNYNPFLGRVFVPRRRKLSILAGELLRSRLQNVQEQVVTLFG